MKERLLTKYRQLALGLAAAAIGVAGCGGSSTEKPSTTATQAAITINAAPAPAVKPAAHRHPARRHFNPLAPSKAAVNIERAAAIPTDPRRLPPNAVDPANPTPIACLRSGGFGNPHRATADSYVGTYSPTGDLLVMNGPFPNHLGAVSDARAASGGSYAVAAGVFVVQTAVQTERMKAVTDLMARCLQLSGGTGGLRF